MVPVGIEGVIHDEAEDLWEEMEALEVGGRVVVKKVEGGLGM